MSIAFNGTTSRLARAASNLGLTYPFTIFMWTRSAAPSQNGWAVHMGRINDPSTSSDHQTGIMGDSSTFFRGVRSTGSSANAVPGHTRSTNWSAIMVVYTSASSCTCYAGNASVSTNGSDGTAMGLLNIAGFDQLAVGSSFATTPATFWNGDLACLAIWKAGLTSGDFDTLRAGAVPSTVSTANLLDYWSLLNATTLTGINGNVFTATSVTTGGTHPITESAPDTTPPTLSSPLGTGGAGVCSGGVTTNDSTGTLYMVTTGSSTAPTGVQVEAGQDDTGAFALRAVSQAVTALGAQTVASGAVSAGTRYNHYMHKDPAGNRSVVSTSASFTVTAPAATAITLSGPSTGVNGIASSNFTVGANGVITGTIVVTPSDGGAGGTFTPTTVSISSGTPTGTFTYTPASTGAKTISTSDNGGLTDPAPLTYTVSASSGTITSSPIRNNTGALVLGTAFEAFLHNVSTGALIAKKTGLTSHATTGVVTTSDPGVAAGTAYRVVWRNAVTGGEGVETRTAT